MRVKEKIRGLDFKSPKPYWFPLLSSIFVPPHPSILIPFPLTSSKPLIDYSKTLVMVESGGYLPKPPSTSEECLEKQMNIRPDLALTLDFPMKKARGRKWLWLSKEEKERRLEKTIENAKRAIEFKDHFVSEYDHEFELMAVIQGYDLPSIINCTIAMYNLGYEYYALGSVTTQASSRYLCDIIEVVDEVRNVIGEDAWLHVLGIMDLNVILNIRKKITSFDASTNIRSSSVGLLREQNGSYSKPLLPYQSPNYLKFQEANFNEYLKALKKYIWQVSIDIQKEAKSP